MAKWNEKNTIYNRKGNEGGFTWNSNQYITIHSISETMAVSDNLPVLIATMLISEKSLNVSDKSSLFALFDKIYELALISETDIGTSILFEIADSFGAKDALTDYVVLAFINEKFDMLEDLQHFAEIIANENINVKDIVSLEALMSLMDNMGFEDLSSELFAFFETHDIIGMTDHEPRQAISDFMIGAIEDDDRAYDWLIPFNLRVDWRNTKVQAMPEAELTTIELPGEDGSIIVDSTYKDRLFSIVAFSEDGMTRAEKEDLKARITQILDSTKHKAKKLTYQATDTSFEVRYDGQADIVAGPSYIKATIPLRATAYGKRLFDTELHGSGLVSNIDGDTYLRPKHIISGPVSNPAFKMGEVYYLWSGDVEEGEKLIIDHQTYTCYITDNLGKKINALARLTGDFQGIEAGKSVALVADINTEAHITTEYSPSVLW